MLIDKLLFSDTVPAMMKKSLDFNSSRHLLISNNISQMDTPGYKAHDVDFKSQLRDAIGSSSQLNLRTTNERHFGPGKTAVQGISALPYEEGHLAKSNGNNVNIDYEMAKLAENQIDFNAVTQMMMKRGSSVRSAITESASQ
ncbi:MAG: flagellar basal body rod protein FlgB [Nitrospinae bacterium]|nr:flagellar basal body rod protein FlgB [Nitrospinota bacterium]MDA1108213.1 flagellar basal body rod protein FlgB [Nitrospinota bacterium]